ncbi:flagella basal body P-ring formation protein FlgA [Cohaesibacter sp. ES.047]|uniref:flagellar basal body P-ring formation chaperone FlgA n=1 Tax=Cohaesibacter sp. ES.047 TaxID=1798205 RepID=UPI000BB67C73|nr:flagellar basal body P-ring formation chaperone FlgA [Cohaesibacter sp. ES.047]SNY94269.1 flagella basal body P-ring formation protein FlgA [Cohaesibacter sp. ES.047]
MNFVAIRTLILCTFVAGLTLAATSVGTQASSPKTQSEPARLLGNVEVTNRLVTLGDLFHNAGDLSNKAVFRAPSLGQSGTIRAYRVLDAARRAGLTRIAPTDVAIVKVERASEVVTEHDVVEQLKGILRSRSLVSGDGRVDVELTTRLVDQHAVPGTMQPFDIRNLRFDRTTGRFSFNLLVAGRSDIGAVRITGSALETVLTPVLTRNMRPGEIVTESDVIMTPLPLNKAQQANPALMDEVIGKSATRTLRAGIIVNAAYFSEPEIINRSDVVSIIFKAGKLTLSMRGKALASGSKGDVISVQNTQTNKILRGEVTGPGIVQIGPISNQIASLGVPIQ